LDQLKLFLENMYPHRLQLLSLLTITTIFLALIFTVPEEVSSVDYLIDILTFWEKGIWSTSLLGICLPNDAYFSIRVMFWY
jgi:short-chain fatty acids transporter